MYKTCTETRYENRDRLGPSEMGQAGYLLTALVLGYGKLLPFNFLCLSHQSS